MITSDSRHDILGGLDQLKDYVEKIEAVKATNCLNCIHFKEKIEECSKYKARPPARTIVEGCKEWDLNIPF